MTQAIRKSRAGVSLPCEPWVAPYVAWRAHQFEVALGETQGSDEASDSEIGDV